MHQITSDLVKEVIDKIIPNDFHWGIHKLSIERLLPSEQWIITANYVNTEVSFLVTFLSDGTGFTWSQI